MMPSKNISAPDRKNTEQKIKSAAQKLFIQKGFAATKTRDITKEAGINSALLHYYFRSKEKLFEIIMRENLSKFLQVMSDHFNNISLTIEQKIEILVNAYIDLLIKNPDLPLFILNEMNSDRINNGQEKNEEVKKIIKYRTIFSKELEQAINVGRFSKVNPYHIISNLMGLTIFPFIAQPMLTGYTGKINRKQFNEMMLERKKLIPIWMGAMLKVKY